MCVINTIYNKVESEIKMKCSLTASSQQMCGDGIGGAAVMKL